jgi:hypothetical protein
MQLIELSVCYACEARRLIVGELGAGPPDGAFCSMRMTARGKA